MKPEEKQAYDKLERFVSSISDRDSSILRSDFFISTAVIDEIYDSIDDYYDPGTKLSISPFSQSAPPQPGGRGLIDFYSMNNGGLGVECLLLADGETSEAILHVEFSFDGDECKLQYKYIGS